MQKMYLTIEEITNKMNSTEFMLLHKQSNES